MVGGDGIADLLEDRGLASAGRGHDESARSFPDRSDEIDDPLLEKVGRGLQTEFLDGIDRCQVLKSDRMDEFLVGASVDLEDLPELGAIPLVWGVDRALDMAPFTESQPLDGVGCQEDI
jgi:hypothetical protein